MKTKVVLTGLLWIIGSVSAFAQVQKYPCPTNGNAESNNYTNWTTYTGASQDPQTNNSFVPNFDPLRFGVHNATSNFSAASPMIVNGVDRYGGFAIPNEGTYCFRVGNNNIGGEAELIKYTFTVTEQNKNFKFRYAVVLQDGGHLTGNPGVTMYMTRGNSITPSSSADYVLYNATYKDVIADLDNPYFKRSGVQSDVVYKAWQCVEYDLTAYVGQVVSFCFRTRDCAQVQHFGYAYLDGLCTAWPALASMTLNRSTYCIEQDVIMNGQASSGEDAFFVEVAEVDANNQAIPGGALTNQWFLGEQVPAAFNVTDFFEGKGFRFECGKTYHVKLAVANDCAPWNEQERLIQFVCPTVSAGPDTFLCCGDGTQTDPFAIGAPGQAGSTYSWTSVPEDFTSNLPNPAINPQTSTAYIVTRTTAEGCIARDTMVVRFKPASNLIELSVKYTICEPRPLVTVNITPYGCENKPEFDHLYPYHPEDDVKWYIVYPHSVRFYYVGEGESVYAPNEEGVLYAFYDAGCGHIIYQTVPIEPTSAGSHELIAPNTFTPDGGSVNNIFQILEFGPYAPYLGDITPAYDAIDFRLRLWNRWGENFVTISKDVIGRDYHDALLQGDIQWDGRLEDGTLVQSGVYNYTLEMKYCGTEEFVRVPTPNGEEDQCINWLWFFCTQQIDGWSSQLNVLY